MNKNIYKIMVLMLNLFVVTETEAMAGNFSVNTEDKYKGKLVRLEQENSAKVSNKRSCSMSNEEELILLTGVVHPVPNIKRKRQLKKMNPLNNFVNQKQVNELMWFRFALSNAMRNANMLEESNLLTQSSVQVDKNAYDLTNNSYISEHNNYTENIVANELIELRYALHYAAAQGSIDKIRTLCNQGCDVNQQNYDGATPLYFAAQNGYRSICRYLVNKGANLNIKTNLNVTPLYIAAQYGYVGIVKFLLNRGAEVDAPSYNSYTALHVASLNGYKDIAKMLVEHGASVNVRSKDGVAPIHLASYNGHIVIVKYLLEKGVNIDNCVTDKGINCLYSAVLGGQPAMVDYLINCGVKVDLPKEWIKNALHCATKRGH